MSHDQGGSEGTRRRGHQRTGCLNDFKNIVENRRFPFYFWPSLAPVVQDHTRATRKISVHENNSFLKFILGPESGGLGLGRGCGKRFDRWQSSIYFFKLIFSEFSFI